MRACPACERKVPDAGDSCPYCHVIFAKHRSRREGEENVEGFNRDLISAGALVVEQQRSLSEAIIGLERKNEYTVSDAGGRTLYSVDEESGFWMRQVLGSFRPLVLVVTQTGTNLILFRIEKAFRLWHDRVTLTDSVGRTLGSVVSGFPIPVRWYTVRDHRGATIFRISGAFWRPWTFKIFRGEQPVGEIRKKWSGLMREAFTDADTFAAAFPAEIPVSQKALLMAALFLIDIVHFENNEAS